MFVIRTAFWIVLIILLLPSNETQQQRIYGTAEAAVHDIKTFCVRNPGVCETGRLAFDSFSEKAQFGAKMLINVVRDLGEDTAATATIDAMPRGESTIATVRADAHGTLTEEDLKPAWSAPRG